MFKKWTLFIITWSILGILPILAQPTFTIEDTPISCGATTASVNITVSNFVEVSGMQFTISWDENILGYSSFSIQGPPAILPGLSIINVGTDFTDQGDLTFAWIDGDLSGEMLDNGEILLTINFDINGALPTTLDFTSNVTSILVTGIGSFPPPPISADFVSGTVSIVDGEPPMIECPLSVTTNTDPGMNTAMVDDIAPISFSDDCGTPTISYSTSMATPGLTGIDDISNQTFNVGTTQVTYTATDGGGNETPCIFNVIVEDNNVGDVTFIAASATTPCVGDPVSIDITVQNFINITGAQFTISWDSDILDYTSFSNLNSDLSDLDINDINDAFVDDGDLTFTWTFLSGDMLDNDAVLFTINFDAIGVPTSSVDFTGDVTSILVTGAGLTTLTPIFSDGTVNITDTENPSITCPLDVNMTVQQGITSKVIDNIPPSSFDDNCGTPDITFSTMGDTPGLTGTDNISNESFNLGETIVTYTATDGANNNSSCSFTVTISEEADTPPPSFIAEMATATCGSNSVEVDISVSNFTNVSGIQFTITFDNTVLEYESVSNLNPLIPGLDLLDFGTGFTDNGDLTFAWIDGDLSGETLLSPDTVLFTITFNTLLPPLNSPIDFTSNVTTTLITGIGAFPPPPITANFIPGSVTISPDNEAPVLTCPNPATIECGGDTSPSNTGSATATDNCVSAVTPTFMDVNNLTTCGGTGTISRTWTASDGNGNSTNCIQIITIEDTTNPTFDNPPNTISNINCGDPFPTQQSLSASDNCGSASVSPSVDSFNESCNGYSVTYRWTATDDCDNSTSVTQTFNVLADNTDPTFDNNPNTIADINCGDPLPTQQSLSANDNCGSASVNPSVDSFNENCNGYSVTYRWTATDECNNSTSVTQTFNVLADNTDPTFDNNPNTIADINCGDPLPTQQSLSASDNCGNASVLPSVDPFNESCNGYSVTYRWTATDECENSTSVTQTFNVLADNTDPTFDNNPNTIADINCGDPLPTQQILSASDNCGNASVSPSVDLFIEDPCNGYSVTYRWTATDECNNSTSVTQTFNVLADDADPTFDTSPNAIADINCGDALPTQQTLTASDNCGNASVLPSVDLFIEDPCNGYLVTYRWTATDDCNNSTFITQFFNVLPDIIDPTFDNNPNTIADVNCDDPLPTQQILTASDNCGNASVLPSVDPFTEDLCNGYSVTYRWTATDECNNSTFITQTFNVLPDETNPSFTVPVTANINCGEDYTDLTLTGDVTNESDNCDNEVSNSGIREASFADDLSNLGDCSGSILRTWTLIDICGNEAILTQVINIVPDNIDPTFTVPNNITIDCDDDIDDLTLTGDVTDENDNCDSNVSNTGPTVATYTDDTSDLDNCDGQVIRTWTLTDFCGNTNTQNQTITISPDSEDPSFTVPDDLTITCTDDPTDLSLTGNVNDETDNCSTNLVATFSDQNNLTGCSGTGSITRTWTLVDDCGNDHVQTQTITVEDNVAPVANCFDNIILKLDSMGSVSILPTLLNDGSTDNCANANDLDFSLANTTFTCSDLGSNSATVTVTDPCDNQATCSSSITIEDDIAPWIVCPTDITVTADDNVETAVVDDIGLVSSEDNCSITNTNYTLGIATTGTGVDDASGTNFNMGQTLVTYEVSDNSGNTSTCIFRVTVLGNIRINCATDVTASASTDLCEATVDDISVSIISDINTIDTIFYELTGATSGEGPDDASGATFNVGITTVTYTVIDIFGEEANCTVFVEIQDNQKPSILNCPEDITTSANELCQAMVSWDPPGVEDNCPDVSITGSHAPNDVFDIGLTTVEYIAIDNVGNRDTCSFDVTVVDEMDPNIVCRTDTLVTVSDVNNVNVDNLAPLNASDNCGIESVTYTLTGVTSGSGLDDASGDLFENGETMVTYTATDLAGNSSSCDFKVTVNIASSNIIDCPDNQEVSTDDNLCTAIVNDIAPNIIIDLSNLDSVNFVISGATEASGMDDASGIVFNPGTSVVTYTAYDAFGNEETCSFTILVSDEENPTIQCPENVMINTDADLCTASVNNIEAIANDNCKIDRITYLISGTTNLSGTENASGSIFNLGVSSVQYTAFDDSENSAICSFTVTVNDLQAPSITCPSNQSNENDLGNCSAVVSNISATAVDNCAIESMTYALTGATAANGSGNASGNIFNIGSTTVQYTTTDESGNTASCSFTVIVNDTESPVVDCPNTVSIGLASGEDAVIVDDLEVENLTDNCPNVTLSYELSGATMGSGNGDASGLFFSEGQTTVIYTATDDNGNTSTCSFTVNVSSLILACPENLSDVTAENTCDLVVENIDLNSLSSPLNAYQYVLSGATEGSGDGDVSGTTFNIGTTTVTYSAEDVFGNNTSCSFEVNITDDQNPIITCPQFTPFDLDENTCSLSLEVADLAPASASDNCPDFSITYELSGVSTGSGSLADLETNFPVGTTDIVYTITDQAGNNTSCSFSIMVNDINAPNISCPENVSQTADIGANNDIVENIDGILSIDPCGTNDLSYELSGATTGSDIGNASGLAFNIGNTTVTYIASDLNGNSSSCSFIITIIPDATGGEIIACPSNINQDNDEGNCSAIVDNIAPLLLTDLANINSIAYSIEGSTIGSGEDDASGHSFNVGTSTVTYVATDINGNIQSCSFNVIVSDTEMPTWTGCPIDITVDANNDNCTGIASWIEPAANDNCNFVEVIREQDSGDSFPIGTTNFTYSATDAAGNSSVCNFTVTVQDVQAPNELSCPNDIIVSTASDACNATVNWDAPIATDACSEVSLSSNILNGSTFDIGEQTIVYTATDLSGNSASCSFSVRIIDTTSPFTLNCPPNAMIATTGGDCEAIHTWSPPIFTDLCSTFSVTSTHQTGDVFPAGQTTNVVYLAIDSEGNDTTCTFQITVVDEDAPNLSTCPDNIVSTANDESCQGLASWSPPTATDLCDEQVDIVADFESGSLFDLGQTTVTYTATDGSGNSTTCNFTVQVDDISAPVLACPQNIVLAADGSIIEDPDGLILSATPGTNCDELIIEYSEPSAFDNCTNEVTINVQGLATGSTFMGENPIEWEAIDPSQNSSTCSFSISVMASENIPIEVSPNTTPCPGLDVNLFVTELQGATYSWEGPENWTASGPSPIVSAVSTLNAGTYSVTCTLPNGCTSVGSTQLAVEDAPMIESTSNGPLCIGSTLELSANTSGVYDSWSWTGPNGFSSTEQNPIIENPGTINSGEYFVTGLTDAGCSNSAQVSVIISDPPASPQVDLECESFICPGESCMLFGTQYAINSEYRWYVTGPDGNETAILNNANTLIVSPMESGEYTYRYEVLVNGCLSESVSTSLLVLANPMAVDDVFDIEYESVLEGFQVTGNDLLDDRLELTIIPVTTPSNGSLLKLEGDNFIYTPSTQFLGTDVFDYQICYTCDGNLVCDQATVTINVNFDGPCEVPDVITPNGDGFNDNLFVTCLETEDFPNNEMIIYNKWGDEVFRESPYQNKWDGTWKGESSKDLPDGTYYYVFKTAPSVPIQKGSFTIFR